MEFYNSRAIYLQIADHVIRRVLSKDLTVGDRISSVRELAAEIEVNPNTVAKSYGWLADIGVILMRRGKGYYITDRAYDVSRHIVRNELLDIDLPKMIEKARLLDLSLNDLLKNYTDEKEK